MSSDVDSALFNFQKLRLQERGLTEADTRAKIIDEIFKSCLGWSETDIFREQRINDGFIDYVFSIDGIPRIIVEAKKSGMYFEIPVNLRSRRYKINGALSKVESVRAAIDQAQKYCVEKGIKYGIVTNGHQFIIFQAFVESKEWRSENCIVYSSSKDIENYFVDFWNTLSKNAVRLNWLRKYLVGEPKSINYCRPLDRIHNKDEILMRNHLAGIIEPFTHFIFEEITEDSKIDLLKNCYVYNKSFDPTDQQVRSSFTESLAQKSKEQNIEDFIEGKDTAGKFQVNFYKCTEFLRKEKPEGTVSVLLGGIGSGKTTFLHRFFKIVLYPEEKVLWFYVDFRTAPTELKDIRGFIVERIIKFYEMAYAEKLKEKLISLDVYKPQLSLEWLTKLFTVLKVLGFTLSLVIDNVDQHYQLYPEMQQKVYLEAQYLTDTLKTVTILSLREESFFRHGFSGAYGAFFVSTNHVTPPNFHDLLMARINYLLEVLNLPDNEIQSKVKTKRPLLRKETDDLKAFFNVVRDSFKSETSRQRYIMQFIEKIAGSNMRKGLDMFNLFLISGNTKLYEMLEYYKSQGFYIIAYHHVLKSIILGECRYYCSKRSHVLNVFDINPGNTSSHFLHLKILQYAKDRISYEAGGERGFVSIGKLKQEGEKILITPEGIEESLSLLARFGLIFFDNFDPEKVKEATYFKITSTGLYYLEELCGRFVYLDLVWVDTPIADESVERELRYLVEETDMQQRFRRTEKFLDYLCSMEKADFEDNPFYFGSELGKHKFMDNVVRRFKNDRKHIEEKLLHMDK